MSAEGERRVYEELHREEASAMPYVTSWERIAMEKGSLEEARTMVLEVLEERFGAVPPGLAERIQEIEDQDVLRKLHRLAVRVGSLEEFEVEAGL